MSFGNRPRLIRHLNKVRSCGDWVLNNWPDCSDDEELTRVETEDRNLFRLNENQGLNRSYVLYAARRASGPLRERT